MLIPFASADHSRAYGLPSASLLNMMSEDTPMGPTPDARLPRPGLVSTYSWGSGSGRGGFQQANVAGGGRFVANGTDVLLEGVSIGTISGSGLARWAASATQVVCVADGVAYCYTIATGAFTQIVGSGGLPLFDDVVFFIGRFFFLQRASGRFYWSTVADATAIDGLSFANAEGSPDALVAMVVLNDQLILLGQETVEFWDPSGNADLPVTKNTGRTYSRGAASQDAVVQMDNSFLFVGDDRIVYRAGSVPKRISDYGVEDKLQRCAASDLPNLVAFECVVEGHAFYVLTIPGVGTWACDISRDNEWGEWQSYGKSVFRVNATFAIGGVTYGTDNTTNDIWVFTKGVFLDGTDPIVRLASAFYATDKGYERCDRLTLQSVRGVGTATGQGADPQVEIRWSDDQGRTFGDWKQASLGKVGEYGKRATLRRLGKMKAPGRLFQARTSDPVFVVFQGFWMNDERS